MTADEQADQIYFKAIDRLFVTGDKVAFIQSCHEAEAMASDPELKEAYRQIAATYEKEIK